MKDVCILDTLKVEDKIFSVPTVNIRWLVFFCAKFERGNVLGRKRDIRDLHERGQLYCCGTDRIHRARHQLRHAGSPPRRSPDQQEELLQAAQDSAEVDAAEDGAAGGGEERTVYDCMGKINCSISKDVVV